MNPLSFLLDLPHAVDFSPYLTKGVDVGNGIKLMVGYQYTYPLLIGGPLLLIAAWVLVKTMYARTKFFAMEFGNAGFFGRIKVIAPSLALGGFLLVLGAALGWLGWQSQGYSVTLTAQGVHQVSRSGSALYAWADATSASKRIKSTEFWVVFAQGSLKCRVEFQQRYIGEKLQDKAIAITENALAYSQAQRVD
ncbi:hypothetical protein [Prosthecobacter vanneervenii]|uniref:Uncharacterized protein n=1 Tax=Prosthecobacter vanneervenii TaxID=48466 RepID=A0A7W7YA40_9BACT|nr:hypothetical protein [Prosthecobacter vanneervenii]MBB5032290.1 hypothetical protein [Prosthecobacter vanneervenii]